MRPKRILIVDDAPEFAHLVQDALGFISIQLEITVFFSGEEAWLEALKTRFDLVITDLRLPGISGTELVRRLRSRYPTIKIIAVSGLEEPGLNERTRAAGVDAFYRKPVEIPLLLTKIDNLLSESEEDEIDEAKPIQSGLLSRFDTISESAVQEKEINSSPSDFETIQNFEKCLLKLMQESGADGITWSSSIGLVLVGLGSGVDYKPDSNLVDACSMLKNALKRAGHQQNDTSSLGLLVLPGVKNELIVTSLGKFFFWLLFPADSSFVEVGQAVAAWNNSKNDLLNLLNQLTFLPTPRHPHPPKKTDERKKSPERQVVKVVDKVKVEPEDLPDNRIPKDEVEAFWSSVEPEKESPIALSNAINFEQASSLGLLLPAKNKH